MSRLEERLPTAVLGGISPTMRCAPALVPELTKILPAWRMAYWARRLYPRSAAAARFASRTGDQLRAALRQAAAKADTRLAEALAADIEHLDHVVRTLDPAWISTGAGGAAKVIPQLDHLARLENAALGNRFGGPELATAFRRWREACRSYGLTGVDAHGNPLSIEAAGTELSDAIAAALAPRGTAARNGFKNAAYYRDRITTGTRALRRHQPSEATRSVYGQLETMLGSGSGDPALAALIRQHVLPAVAQSPHGWDRLAAVLDDIAPVPSTDTERVSILIDRVKGVLAELVAVTVPAYRQAYQEAVQHADHIAAVLNHRAARAGRPSEYRVLMPQFSLRAPGRSGTGLPLYFDDAVLVVREGAQPEAFVVFAAQVKAGDAATEAAAGQLVADQTRLLKGGISVDGTRYLLVPPPDLASVTRVFVGTRVPPGTERVTGRVQLVTGPVNGINLARFAQYVLEATGKLK
ncbi:hypothetical protein [Streptomyces ossamyceticus]|uniref:hypothetical protein n=1 Tax=Streptomyces ossamyceticus TaxID=249581 RepID=UPI00343DED3C